MPFDWASYLTLAAELRERDAKPNYAPPLAEYITPCFIKRETTLKRNCVLKLRGTTASTNAYGMNSRSAGDSSAELA